MLKISDLKQVEWQWGGTSSKKTVEYQGEKWMVKQPRLGYTKDKQLVFSKTSQSEHMGSRIFESMGLPAQKTEMAQLLSLEPDYLVVMCRNFVKEGQEFLPASRILSEQRLSAGCDIADLANAKPFDYYDFKDFFKFAKDNTGLDVEKRFWDTFVGDTLVGNFDRHMGNWGVLHDLGSTRFEFAPAFDFDMSLSPGKSAEEIAKGLANPEFLKAQELNAAEPRFLVYGSKKTCQEIFENPPRGLVKSIKDMIPRIDMKKINQIIDSTPGLSDERKEYLKRSVALRNELILQRTYKKIMDREFTEKCKTPEGIADLLESGLSRGEKFYVLKRKIHSAMHGNFLEKKNLLEKGIGLASTKDKQISRIVTKNKSLGRTLTRKQ